MSSASSFCWCFGVCRGTASSPWIGLILATVAAAVGAVLNLGWRAGLPVFLLLGLAAIVL